MFTSLPSIAAASSAGRREASIECVVVVPVETDLWEMLMSRGAERWGAGRA